MSRVRIMERRCSLAVPLVPAYVIVPKFSYPLPRAPILMLAKFSLLRYCFAPCQSWCSLNCSTGVSSYLLLTPCTFVPKKLNLTASPYPCPNLLPTSIQCPHPPYPPRSPFFGCAAQPPTLPTCPPRVERGDKDTPKPIEPPPGNSS